MEDLQYMLTPEFNMWDINNYNTKAMHRRLSSSPGFVDFVVVVGLSIILFYILRVLQNISNNWRLMMQQRIDAALLKRRLVKDPFRNTYGYSWDYVMVFRIIPIDQKLSLIQEKRSLKFILDRLAESGLQTKLFYSIQHDEVYVKIRCPLPRLMKEADRINYRLLLEPTALANKLRIGNLTGPEEKQWKPIEVPITSDRTPFEPYDYIYCEFISDEKEMYTKYANGSVFRSVDRLKLIANIISARLVDGGSHLDVYRLIKDKCMLTFFPLHDAVELRYLEEKWLRMCQLPWQQHVDIVKDYFGEKIGLFFLWLGHYTTWLMPVAVVGIFAWVNVAANGNDPDAQIMPYFATFMAIWSTLFLEYWKRKEKLTAMKWGTVGYEDEEQVRAEFEGEKIQSPVDGSDLLYFPRNQFLFRVMVSSNIILTLVTVVIGVVVGIFILRIILSSTSALTLGGVQWGATLTAVINAVQIQVLNALYNTIAIGLTDYENHRTNTAYEDSLIAKTFIFQFVNSFASLFYIAFVKPYIPTLNACVGSCMSELQASLGTIFLTRLATGSVLKVVIPYVMQKMKERSESAGVVQGGGATECSEVEVAYIQAEYHVMLGPFMDYANLVMQFGYATMFIAAYPLATVMSLVSNYVEMRVDAWKLCQQCRRPEPRTSEDIGTWYIILEIISMAAVLVNSGLVAFTGTNTVNYPWYNRVWIFFGMSFGILALKYVIAINIPDTPEEVEIQLARQEYYLDKIVKNIPDDDNEHSSDGLGGNKSKYTVRVNDDDPL